MGETAITLLDIVDKSIDMAKERYATKVIAVITDNDSTMTAMGRRCGLMFSACNSHTANLLVHDIILSHNDGSINSASDVLANVRSVQTEFKRIALESKLISLGGTKPKLPCRTRWCSQRGACKSFLSNLSKMKQIAAEAEVRTKVASPICELLFADLALKLLNMPASTAQLERVFSNWSDIHWDKRNRLSEDRSKKLLSIYHSLKMNQIDDVDMDDDIEELIDE